MTGSFAIADVIGILRSGITRMMCFDLNHGLLFHPNFFQRSYLLVGRNYIFLSHVASNTSNHSINVPDCAIVRCCECELLWEQVQSTIYGSFETHSWPKAGCSIANDRPTSSMDASMRCSGQGMPRLISYNAISLHVVHTTQ